MRGLIIYYVGLCCLLAAPFAIATTQAFSAQTIANIIPLFQPTAELGDPNSEVFVAQKIRIGKPKTPGVFPVFFAEQVGADSPIGYVFYSGDFIQVGGFSGAPINALVAVDALGHFLGVSLPNHNEPIFLHGLGVQSLLDFLNQYSGKRFTNPIFLAPPNTPPTSVHQIDAVARATASAIAINKAITLSALQALSSQFGIEQSNERGEVRYEYFEPLSYAELNQKHYLAHIIVSAQEFVRDIEAISNRIFLCRRNARRLC